MRTKMCSVALLALVLCGAVMASYAQTGGAAGWSGHRHGYVGHMARALNLTDAQKQQIKTIVQAQRPTMSPIRPQLAQNRASMLTAAASGTFNQAKVQSLANQRALLIAQLVVPRAYILSQIYNQVLTPEQKAKADQMRQNQIARITQHLQTMGQSDAQTTRQ